MKTTFSVIKADVGSIGGDIKPSQRLMEGVEHLKTESSGLFSDCRIYSTGDYVAILLSQKDGALSEMIVKLSAWLPASCTGVISWLIVVNCCASVVSATADALSWVLKKSESKNSLVKMENVKPDKQVTEVVGKVTLKRTRRAISLITSFTKTTMQKK